MSEPAFLSISPKIHVLPVVHGSGDFAVEVRERLLRLEPDCLAVPLPPSFQQEVEDGVLDLPSISVVTAEEEVRTWDSAPEYGDEEGGEDSEDVSSPWERAGEAEEEGEEGFNFVPVDPCQPVIAALRAAMEERVPRVFIDIEVEVFKAESRVFPDPYALKKVSLEAVSAALLTASPPPKAGSQREARVRWMAARLRALEAEGFEKIAFVCQAMDWHWVRQAYQQKFEVPEEAPNPGLPRRWPVEAATLAFVLGELPFITALYEKRREELRGDKNLSIDGVKELILDARAEWLREYKPALNWVTPQRIQIFLQYVRNLTLQAGRLTPDLFTLVLAAQQIAGDAFALTLAECARKYPYQEEPQEGEGLRAGIGEAEFPDGGVGPMKSRLEGSEISWRAIELKPRPPEIKKNSWRQRWNPFTQCSWPPEDTKIESFHTHVREQARAILGQDLARSEKFTTSIMDGIDMRETLRNWHTGDLWVKELPPARGSLDV
ncbi:MAG: hypothetical protein HOE85_12820, partial [Nitrospinaceae bacterium]|nr:hypothetical protein [Nitrospinaceae bacterium]